MKYPSISVELQRSAPCGVAKRELKRKRKRKEHTLPVTLVVMALRVFHWCFRCSGCPEWSCEVRTMLEPTTGPCKGVDPGQPLTVGFDLAGVVAQAGQPNLPVCARGRVDETGYSKSSKTFGYPIMSTQ